MTGALVRAARLVAQLCYLPIAPARYLHDYLGFATVNFLLESHVDEVRLYRRGYRLDWAVKWSEDAPVATKRMPLFLPIAIGIVALTVGFPFARLVLTGTPVTMGLLERAAAEFVGLQLVALPWPRARDIPRWRAVWPESNEGRGQADA